MKMPKASRKNPAITIRPTNELLQTVKIEQIEEREEPVPQYPSSDEYRCAICCEIFFKLSDLAAHVKSAYMTESDVLCETCNKSFSSAEARDKHACQIPLRNEVFPYMKCIDCEESYHISKNSDHDCVKEDAEEILTISTNFPNEYNLTSGPEAVSFFGHSVFDNSSPDPDSFVTAKKTCGRKPKKNRNTENYYNKKSEGMECEMCGKVLRSYSSLVNHKKTHNKSDKYECPHCEKKFTTLDYFIRHQRVHTKEKPYKCEYCGKAFSQQNTLTIHNTIHTGEKPYECNVCGKTFRVQDYLTKHMRTHTGEKPYQCDMCERSFAQQSALNNHRRSGKHSTDSYTPKAEKIEQEM